MMSTIIAAKTLKQLIEETRLLVGDLSDVSNTWSEEDVIAAVNYAVQSYCRLTGCNYIEESKTLTSGKTEPINDYLMIERCKYNGNVLLITSKQDEEIKNPSWESKTGTPLRWMIYDGKTIRVVPSTSGTLTVGFVKQPALMSALTDTVDSSIPFPHHIFLKYAAASWLMMIDGDKQDFQESAMMMQVFAQGIGVAPAPQRQEGKE